MQDWVKDKNALTFYNELYILLFKFLFIESSLAKNNYLTKLIILANFGFNKKHQNEVIFGGGMYFILFFSKIKIIIKQ